MKHKRSFALGAVVMTVSILLCTAAVLPAQERVRAGYSGISGYQVPLWLAVDLGLFKKYGLNLEPILFRGGAESTHALTGGEIQFDVVAPQPHIAANLSGADIIIIGTYFNKHTYSFVTRPGIRSPQELRGKKVGVLSVVGLNQIVVATALRHWGVDEKSVTLVRSGGSRDRFAALQNGLVDATVLTGAFVDRAKAAGMHVLLDLGDLEDSFPTVSLMTTRTLQSSKRNLVRELSARDRRRDLRFQERSGARPKESFQMDAHSGQGLAGQRLQELRAEDFLSTLQRSFRRSSRRRRFGQQSGRCQRKKSAGIHERRCPARAGEAGFFQTAAKAIVGRQ